MKTSESPTPASQTSQTNMKATLLLALATLCLSSCDKQPSSSAAPPAKQEEKNPHIQAIADYQAAQILFKSTIGTIKNQASYKEAQPALQEVVTNFKELAKRMEKLDPPAPEKQKEYTQLLIQGDSRSEPNAGNMLQFMTINEEQSAAYLSEFVAAAQAAAEQLDRLYGRYSHNKPETKPSLQLDPDSIQILPPAPSE